MKTADKIAIGAGVLLLVGGGLFVVKQRADAQKAAAVAAAQARPAQGADVGQLIGGAVSGAQQAFTSISGLWSQFNQLGQHA